MYNFELKKRHELSDQSKNISYNYYTYLFILFIDINSEHENENIVSSRTLPWTMPMALSMSLKKNNKKPIRRHEEYYDEKGKDTKISKIFQLAVTALSFLAFGGYLLTLIITAIRRNNGNGNGNVVIFSVIIKLNLYNNYNKILTIRN